MVTIRRPTSETLRNKYWHAFSAVLVGLLVQLATCTTLIADTSFPGSRLNLHADWQIQSGFLVKEAGESVSSADY